MAAERADELLLVERVQVFAGAGEHARVDAVGGPFGDAVALRVPLEWDAPAWLAGEQYATAATGRVQGAHIPAVVADGARGAFRGAAVCVSERGAGTDDEGDAHAFQCDRRRQSLLDCLAAFDDRAGEGLPCGHAVAVDADPLARVDLPCLWCACANLALHARRGRSGRVARGGVLGGIEQGEHVRHGAGDGRVEIVVGVGSPCEHEAFGEVIGSRAQASRLCECRRSQILARHRQDHNQSPSR